MSVDMLADLAGRVAHLGERVERLETLEYGTEAFPTGSGLICDIVVTTPVASVTCTPIVPLSFEHIIAIVAAGVDNDPSSGKMRVTIGGSPASYEFATRQESHTFPAGFSGGAVGTFVDTESASAVSLAYWDTVHPAAHETLVINADKQGTAFYLFPQPGQSSGGFFLGPYAIWLGYAAKAGPSGVVGAEMTVDQGGFANYSSPIPFTSITWTATPPDLFVAGSRFTVYGMA